MRIRTEVCQFSRLGQLSQFDRPGKLTKLTQLTKLSKPVFALLFFAISAHAAGCDVNSDSSTNVADVQLCVNQAISVLACTTGDIDGNGACNVVDVQRVVNAALGGTCVTGGSGGTGSGLPAGVTLQDPDGGLHYFARWSNSFPDDPGFFPIAVFGEYDLNGTAGIGGTKVDGWKAAGINTIVNLYNGALDGSPTDISIVKSKGMYALVHPYQNTITSSFSTTYSSAAAGWLYQDEIDGSADCSNLTTDYQFLMTSACTIGTNGKINPDILLNLNNNIRAKDNTRPIYQGYTNAFALDWFPGGPVATLAAAADLIGYDVYPLVDRRSNYNGKVDVGHPWGAYQTVTIARANAGYAKPIWPDVENSATDTDSGMNTTRYQPTGADIQALAWNYIIGGARGITYFNHCFCSVLGGAMSGDDDLNNPALASQRTAIIAVNARLKALAPVINDRFALGYETHTGQINTMVKYSGGNFYIFAAPKASGSQTVTFTVKTGTTVTVVDENRTLAINGAQFTDSFANENTIHIYKISGAAWPDATNTGVPAGTVLHSCPTTITTSGTYDSCLFSGDVSIRASNVTIKNSQINGSVDAQSGLAGQQSGLVIMDSTINCGCMSVGPSDTPTAIQESNYTLLRVNLYNSGHGAAVKNNVTIQDSYIHGLGGNTDAHKDGIFVGDGTNVVIRHNTIECNDGPLAGCTSAIGLLSDFGVISNFTIDQNLLNTNGSYCFYGGGGPQKPYVPNHISFTNNHFGRKYNAQCGFYGPVTYFDSNAPGNVWSGNVWDDTGVAVPAAF
jgi:hypothetical protein